MDLILVPYDAEDEEGDEENPTSRKTISAQPFVNEVGKRPTARVGAHDGYWNPDTDVGIHCQVVVHIMQLSGYCLIDDGNRRVKQCPSD
jgi:hypothetical protein